jgi:hypothetical protein
MSAVKIILSRPHVEVEDEVIHYCVSYRLTQAVMGVLDGEVGYEPSPGETDADVLTNLKMMAVDHANLQTENLEGFTTDDVITWESRA